jgi:hypothetical protein
MGLANWSAQSVRMDRKLRTRAVRVGTYLLGAALDYLFLVVIGGLKFDNYVFVFFFAGVFMTFACELARQVLGLDIDPFRLTAGEGAAEAPLDDYSKLFITLIACLAMLWFQTRI